MLYIASPFTHKDPEIMRLRYVAAFEYTAARMSFGEVCFSPIVYGYEFFAQGKARPDFEFWQDLNDRMILASTRVEVLKMPGWEASRGIFHEVGFAQEHGIPVTYTWSPKWESIV